VPSRTVVAVIDGVEDIGGRTPAAHPGSGASVNTPAPAAQYPNRPRPRPLPPSCPPPSAPSLPVHLLVRQLPSHLPLAELRSGPAAATARGSPLSPWSGQPLQRGTRSTFRASQAAARATHHSKKYILAPPPVCLESGQTGEPAGRPPAAAPALVGPCRPSLLDSVLSCRSLAAPWCIPGVGKTPSPRERIFISQYRCASVTACPQAPLLSTGVLPSVVSPHLYSNPMRPTGRACQ